MNTSVYVLKECTECKFIQLQKTRNGKEFNDMDIVNYVKGAGSKTSPDIIVFQNPATYINRDLIIVNGTFYYTDVYNGLLELDRDNIQYIYPVI